MEFHFNFIKNIYGVKHASGLVYDVTEKILKTAESIYQNFCKAANIVEKVKFLLLTHIKCYLLTIPLQKNLATQENKFESSNEADIISPIDNMDSSSLEMVVVNISKIFRVINRYCTMVNTMEKNREDKSVPMLNQPKWDNFLDEIRSTYQILEKHFIDITTEKVYSPL